MSERITVEQAVEAVCSVWVDGVPSAPLGRIPMPPDAPVLQQMIAALRAIEPQEPPANPDADLQRARKRAHDAEAALGRLREVLSSLEQAVRDVTREVEVACCPVDGEEPSVEEVDRVADAIYRCDGSSYSFGANDEATREPYMVRARAALAAMKRDGGKER